MDYTLEYGNFNFCYYCQSYRVYDNCADALRRSPCLYRWKCYPEKNHYRCGKIKLFTDKEKRFLLILFVLALLSALFSQLAQAQEYKVTEYQLQELEAIYQNYKANNVILQSQVQSLKTESQTLSAQLTKEREISRALSNSCAELDVKLSTEQQKMEKLNEELNAQKLNYQKTIKWFILSLALNFILLCAFVFLLLLVLKK